MDYSTHTIPELLESIRYWAEEIGGEYDSMTHLVRRAVADTNREMGTSFRPHSFTIDDSREWWWMTKDERKEYELFKDWYPRMLVRLAHATRDLGKHEHRS